MPTLDDLHHKRRVALAFAPFRPSRRDQAPQPKSARFAPVGDLAGLPPRIIALNAEGGTDAAAEIFRHEPDPKPAA